MTTDASREAFEAWHSDRAKRISKEIDDLAARWITEGTNDSPATKREALLYVMGGVDGTGWDAWQASRKQALEEVAALFPHESEEYFGSTIQEEIEELK